MIAEQIKKRNRSFLIMALIIGVFLFALFIVEKIYSKPDSDTVANLVLCGAALIFLANIFLFKSFYHWSKAKSYPGSLCLLVFLGPLGLFIIYYLKDLSSDEEKMGT